MYVHEYTGLSKSFDLKTFFEEQVVSKWTMSCICHVFPHSSRLLFLRAGLWRGRADNTVTSVFV